MFATSDHLEPTPTLHLDDPVLVCTLPWKAAYCSVAGVFCQELEMIKYPVHLPSPYAP